MPRLPLLWSWVARVLSDVRRRGGGGGAGGCRGGGGGRSKTNQSLSRRGLGFCAERCHPQNACGPVNTEQTYRHRGTGGNTATETRRTRPLCTASHLCLEIGPIGPMGGIWIRGESGPGGLSVLVVPQHRPVYTAAFWWWRPREGGGYLVPPQQLSNAEVPGGQAHGAWDEGFTNTRRGRRTRGGGSG